MGASTDANLAAWQERAGIEPARGEMADALERLSQAAFELIKVVELERSGIRDGDGYWHGSDVMSGMARDVAVAFSRWKKAEAKARGADADTTQTCGHEKVRPGEGTPGRIISFNQYAASCI
jgi:hypothetical protein